MAQPIWVGFLRVELQAERNGDGLGAKSLVVFDHVHLVECQAGLCMHVGIEDHFAPLVLSDGPVLVAVPRAQPTTGSSSIFGVGYNALGAIGHEARRRLNAKPERELGRLRRECARLCVRLQTPVRADLLDRWRLQDRNDDVGQPESGRSRVAADGRSRPLAVRFVAVPVAVASACWQVSSKTFGAILDEVVTRPSASHCSATGGKSSYAGVLQLTPACGTPTSSGSSR
jgi:hypothetical protein